MNGKVQAWSRAAALFGAFRRRGSAQEAVVDDRGRQAPSPSPSPSAELELAALRRALYRSDASDASVAAYRDAAAALKTQRGRVDTAAAARVPASRLRRPWAVAALGGATIATALGLVVTSAGGGVDREDRESVITVPVVALGTGVQQSRIASIAARPLQEPVETALRIEVVAALQQVGAVDLAVTTGLVRGSSTVPLRSLGVTAAGRVLRIAVVGAPYRWSLLGRPAPADPGEAWATASFKGRVAASSGAVAVPRSMRDLALRLEVPAGRQVFYAVAVSG